jgi:hypothetical protein
MSREDREVVQNYEQGEGPRQRRLRDTVADFILKIGDIPSRPLVSQAGLVDALSVPWSAALCSPQTTAFEIPADTLDTLLNNGRFIPHLTDLLLTTSRLELFATNSKTT